MRPFPLTLLVLLAALTVGCGGKISETEEDTAPKPVEPEEARTLELRTVNGEDETSFSATWRSNAEVVMHETIHDLSCVEPNGSEAEPIQIWMEPVFSPEMSEDTLDYLVATVVSNDDFDTLFVEHAGGVLECPVQGQDFIINVAEGQAKCFVFGPNPPFADKVVGNEPCPCSGFDEAITLGSIRRIGFQRTTAPPEDWESTKAAYESAGLGKPMSCVADRVILCVDDCEEFDEGWDWNAR